MSCKARSIPRRQAQLRVARRMLGIVAVICFSYSYYAAISANMAREAAPSRYFNTNSIGTRHTSIDGKGFDGMVDRYPYFPYHVLAECGLTSGHMQLLGKSLGFVKLHKTGGSTIAAMINRIVDGRNLMKMIPEDNTYLGWPNDFPGRVRGIDDVMGTYGKYDAVSNHAIWNATLFRMYLKEPMLSFTMLREPLSRTISAYNFFDSAKYKSWRHCIDNLKQVRNVKSWVHVVFLNSMAAGLGWYHQMQRSTIYDQDIDRIREFIERLDREMDVVMILENMEESLFLLSEALPNLELAEMVWYNMKESEASAKVYPNESEMEELSSLLLVDRMLYDHFSQKLMSWWRNRTKTEPKLFSSRKACLSCLYQWACNNTNESSRLFATMKRDSGAYTSLLWKKQQTRSMFANNDTIAL